MTAPRSSAAKLGPVGIWCSLPTTYSVEILARCGFDWLCVDLQHGFMTMSDLLGVMQTAAITDTPVLVRVEDPGSLVIHRALDAGARGIIFPTVNTPEQAAEAVAMCRYPPSGHRSWGPARLALVNGDYSPESANDEALCIVMIESREALTNLDAILAVPGVDIVLVGPSDLAIDLGHSPAPLPVPGPHGDALKLIASRCVARGVTPAVFADSADGVRIYRDLGYVMFGAGNDAALLRSAARDLVQGLRSDDSVPESD
jgi:4-hydroxy-2-oxoheptanedioate aldolase